MMTTTAATACPLIADNVKNGFAYRFYRLLVLLLFMDSMYPWYMWENSLSKATMIMGGLAAAIFLCRTPDAMKKKTWGDVSQIFFIILYGIYYITLHGAGLGLVINLSMWVVVILLRDEFKLDLFRFITKWMGIVMIVSSVGYVLWLCRIYPLSPQVVIWNDGQYVENNYYLFLISVSVDNIANFFRFKSIFMEPGHMTMGVVPLLIANRFNLRNKYVLFLFIGELLSFSLAGYITMALGCALINLHNHFIKHMWSAAVFIAISIGAISLFGNSEMLDKFLWNRLEKTDDGSISGDNRTTAKFDKQYEQVFNHMDQLLIGKDNFTQDLGDGGNAGFKVHVVRVGLVGIALMVLMYWPVVLARRRYSIFVLAFILTLLLYQSGGPTWICCMYGFTLGCTYLTTPAIDECRPVSIRKRQLKAVPQ